MSGTYSENFFVYSTPWGALSMYLYNDECYLLLVVSLLSSTYIGSFMLELTLIKSGLELTQTKADLQGIAQGSITYQCGILHP